MAVYKVPQDVEADDKLIGPFSFKQFVFIIITVASLYMAYALWRINPVMSILPLPFAIFFGILGFWPRRKQPIEVYLAALVHFWTKPRTRIWSQEGHVEHIKITAPEKIEHTYTDGLSNNEVRSNLNKLAQTLDSRGWSVKNVEVQDIAFEGPSINASDRLAMPSQDYQQGVQPMAIHQRDDILDPANNRVAHKFDQMSQASTQQTREAAIEQMRTAAQKASQEADKKPRKKKQKKSNTSTMTEEPSAAILNLANNSDLSVSTLAKQAEQSMPSDTTIELH